MADSGAIRAGRAFVELFADDSKLARGLAAAAGKLKAWGSAMTAIGGNLAAVGAAITAPFLGALKLFEDMRAEAQKTGLIVTDENFANVKEFRLILRELRAAMLAVSIAVGEALLPVFRELRDYMRYNIDGVLTWIHENQKLIALAFKMGAAFAAAGLGLVVLGKAVALGATVFTGLGLGVKLIYVALTSLPAILGVLKGAFVGLFGLLVGGAKLAVAALAALFSPIGLITAALVGLTAYLLYQSDIWEKFGATGKKAWGGIVDAIKAGELELAMKIAMAGMKQVWADGLHAMFGWWNDWQTGIAKGLVLLGEAFGILDPAKGKELIGILGKMPGGFAQEAAAAARELQQLREEALKKREGALGPGNRFAVRVPLGDAKGAFNPFAALRLDNGSRKTLEQEQLEVQKKMDERLHQIFDQLAANAKKLPPGLVVR